MGIGHRIWYINSFRTVQRFSAGGKIRKKSNEIREFDILKMWIKEVNVRKKEEIVYRLTIRQAKLKNKIHLKGGVV